MSKPWPAWTIPPLAITLFIPYVLASIIVGEDIFEFIERKRRRT